MDINGGYNFSWKDIGDISEGRPNLGMNTRVEIYRLMQYTMRAVLDKELGEEMARDFCEGRQACWGRILPQYYGL